MHIQLLAFYILFIYSLTYSQYHFEHISIQDGLSQSTVYDIFKDHKGFMWFATDYGLDRYDGVKMKVYTTKPNEQSICSDRIYTIAQTKNDILWIGTDFGLTSLNPKTNKINNYYEGKDSLSLSNNFVNDIFIDNNDYIWVGTQNGLTLIRPGKLLFSTFLKKGISITKIYMDPMSEDILWLGTSSHGLIRFNKNNYTYNFFVPDLTSPLNSPSNQIRTIELFQKNLIIGTTDGLYIFDLRSKRIIKRITFIDLGHTFSSNRVVSLEAINDSTLWVGTWNDGIVIYDKKMERVGNIRYSAENTLGLNNNRVMSILKDDEGLVWIGTNSRGINIYNSNRELFKILNNDFDAKIRFTSNEIWQVLEDSDGILWIGTDKGLNRYDRKNNRVTWITPENSELSNNDVFSLMEAPGKLLWIGTRRGLDIYDLDKCIFIDHLQNQETYGYILNQLVLQLYNDNNEYVWAGSFAGLAKIDIKSRKIVDGITYKKDDSKTLSGKSVFAIEEFDDNHLWIGTEYGLNLLDKSKFEVVQRYFHEPHKNSLGENRIYSIHKDKQGIFWFGTFGGGIDRYDAKTGIFKNYREYNGLANDIVYGFVEDEFDDLWISTNFGLSRFNKKYEIFTNYTIKDGLQAYEFNYGAYCSTHDNEIYFGGVNGLNSFYPSDFYNEKFKPNLVFTGITVYQAHESAYIERIIDLTYYQPEYITLEYDENYFTLDFAILDYINPARNHYSYRINELQTNFVNNENRSFASFNNLPPGEYNITVTGSNSRQIIGGKEISIKVIINPPLWKTNWAYLLYIIICFSVGAILLHYRKIRYEREIAVLEKADRLKSEFLAQMSHEIRSPINVILSFSNLLRSELEEKLKPELKESFNSISTAGIRIIRTIDLILNMSEIQTGTYDYKPVQLNLFTDVLNGLISEFGQKAKDKNLLLKLDNKADNPVIFADEYTIVQIFANLIDNAIKYTEKGRVEINITNGLDNVISVSVKDTGKGIKKEYIPYLFTAFTQEEQGYTRQYEGNGLGLALVKKYCEINRAEITVESNFGEGSEFTVLLKSDI